MDSADRDRKRAWKERERAAARAEFPLPDALLQAMFDAVETHVEQNGCDHSHRFTKQWLAGNEQPVEKVIGWLEAHGGFCDCEVSANAHDHWMQNK